MAVRVASVIFIIRELEGHASLQDGSDVDGTVVSSLLRLEFPLLRLLQLLTGLNL